MKAQVLLSASCFSVIHLRIHLPSLREKNVFSQKECLWADLVITYGLKTAPFNSHMHVLFQAFIQTRAQDEASFQTQYLLTSVAVCVYEPGLCVHSLGAVIYSMRDTRIQTREGEMGEREKEGGGKKVRERVSKEETRGRENKPTQQTGKYLRCFGICLDSVVLDAVWVISRKTIHLSLSFSS